ncbi:MAG: hypothetical protein OXC63_11070 [Aestuariivita sp.]|nr:hypothetical protein [Aestuariivita sp.]MCY4347723.1 hypothetical protein [Aestuariivita sp.]
MFLELIGTVFAGLAVAGVIMLTNKVVGGRLPRWLIPVGAGLGMFATTLISEYSWYQRTVASLPTEMVVAQSVENFSWYRPWTYFVPYIDRFAAIDAASLLKHPLLPDQRIIDAFFFGRWQTVNHTRILLDCNGLRRALLADDSAFDRVGRVENVSWISVPAEDPILQTGCEVS